MIDAARAAGRPPLHPHLLARRARAGAQSDYGWSKARSERVVAASGLDWTIIRPPAVYGPGDRETFELFKMARRGLVALPPKGRFSVIHVEDLCRLILALLDAPDSVGETYEPDDGTPEGWDHRHFARTLGRVFGKRAGHPGHAEGGGEGRRPARPARPPLQGQADPRPRPLFLPSRLGGRPPRRARPRRCGRPPSAPPPASRRPPTGIWSRAGSADYPPPWKGGVRGGCAKRLLLQRYWNTKAAPLATSPSRKMR